MLAPAFANIISIAIKTGLLIMVMMAPFKWEKELGGILSKLPKQAGKFGGMTAVALGGGLATSMRNTLDRRKMDRAADAKTFVKSHGTDPAADAATIDRLTAARVQRTGKDKNADNRLNEVQARGQIEQEIASGDFKKLSKDFVNEQGGAEGAKWHQWFSNPGIALGRVLPDSIAQSVLKTTSTAMFAPTALKNRFTYGAGKAGSTISKFARTNFAEGTPSRIGRRIKANYEDIEGIDSIAEVMEYDRPHKEQLERIYAERHGFDMRVPAQRARVSLEVWQHMKDKIRDNKDPDAYNDDPYLRQLLADENSVGNDGSNAVGSMVATYMRLLRIGPRELSRYARGEKSDEPSRDKFMAGHLAGLIAKGQEGYMPDDFRAPRRSDGNNGNNTEIDDEDNLGGNTNPPRPRPNRPSGNSRPGGSDADDESVTGSHIPEIDELARAITGLEESISSQTGRTSSSMDKLKETINHVGKTPLAANITPENMARANKGIVDGLRKSGFAGVANDLQSHAQDVDVNVLPPQVQDVARQYQQNDRIQIALSATGRGQDVAQTVQKIAEHASGPQADGLDLKAITSSLQRSVDTLKSPNPAPAIETGAKTNIGKALGLSDQYVDGAVVDKVQAALEVMGNK